MYYGSGNIFYSLWNKKFAFYTVKKKYKCVDLKKKMDANLRQQTPFVSANEKAPSHGSGLTKCRTSKFPKIYKYFVVIYKCIMS